MKALMLIAVVLMAGCSSVQTIEIPPTKTLSWSNAGSGHAVSVTVIDARTDKRIGQTALFTKDSQMGGPTILTKPEIQDLFATAASDALRAQGFDVTTTGQAKLTVEITEVEMIMTSGFWTSTYTYAAKVKCTATDSGRTFSREFSSSDEWGGVLIPGPRYYAKLSEQISNVMDQAVTDQNLVRILTEKSLASKLGVRDQHDTDGIAACRVATLRIVTSE
jgi:uncharacterized lipoprotein YajG